MQTGVGGGGGTEVPSHGIHTVCKRLTGCTKMLGIEIGLPGCVGRLNNRDD